MVALAGVRCVENWDEVDNTSRWGTIIIAVKTHWLPHIALEMSCMQARLTPNLLHTYTLSTIPLPVVCNCICMLDHRVSKHFVVSITIAGSYPYPAQCCGSGCPLYHFTRASEDLNDVLELCR